VDPLVLLFEREEGCGGQRAEGCGEVVREGGEGAMPKRVDLTKMLEVSGKKGTFV
jgi:hypothetical protein